MTFQIRHDNKVYTVSTVVGGDEVTKVQFVEFAPEPDPPLDSTDED